MLIFSVGSGDEEGNISVNLIRDRPRLAACREGLWDCRSRQRLTARNNDVGGRHSAGRTRMGDAALRGNTAVVWQCLVSHPAIKTAVPNGERARHGPYGVPRPRRHCDSAGVPRWALLCATAARRLSPLRRGRRFDGHKERAVLRLVVVINQPAVERRRIRTQRRRRDGTGGWR